MTGKKRVRQGQVVSSHNLFSQPVPHNLSSFRALHWGGRAYLALEGDALGALDQRRLRGQVHRRVFSWRARLREAFRVEG